MYDFTELYEIEDKLSNDVKLNYKHYTNKSNSTHLYNLSKKNYLKSCINQGRRIKQLRHELENYEYDDNDDILYEISNNINTIHKLNKKVIKRSGWKYIPHYYYQLYGIKQIKYYQETMV